MTNAATISPRPAWPAAVWLAALALAALWAVTIWRLGGMWSALPEYSYGWSVPLLCAMLFLERWRTRPQGAGSEDRSQRTEDSHPSSVLRPLPSGAGPSSVLSKSALLFLLFALLLFIAARLALEVIPNWRIAAWVMALATITLTLMLLRVLLGTGSKAPSAERKAHDSSRPALRASLFAFPICFFLLAVPWPSRFEIPFIQFLTQLNATVTVETLSFLKVAAVRMGNIILIEPGLVGVQEACSGIRSFQSTLMVALFLGEMFRFSFWRRLVFVLLGVFFSFLFNIVRTTFLVLACNRDGLGAVDRFHDPAGWTVFAASFVALAVIGWVLYRNQKQKVESREQRAGGREQRAEDGGRRTEDSAAGEENRKSEIVNPKSESNLQPATLKTRLPLRAMPLALPALLLFALIGTELGINWWFGTFKRPATVAGDWVAVFPSGEQSAKRREQSAESKAPSDREQSAKSNVQSGSPSPLPLGPSPFAPLTITKEVQGMLQYDQGGGWQWQGGGGERWQAFLFEWEKPDSLARQILCSAQALGHQPELCFTRAGMQVSRIYGQKQYVANGVPLVFKVYEFVDRNIPIFVFSCTWQKNVELVSTVADAFQEGGSTFRGIREAIYRYRRGEHGVTDDVRVLKFGVWGPRTIGEAEAAFQQQLALLIQPKK